MKFDINTHQISIVPFGALGLPCVKEEHVVDKGRVSERHRSHYRVDVEKVEGLRGRNLERLRRSTDSLERLLDLIEEEQ